MTGVTVCPDCLATLVDKKPTGITAAVTPDDSWVEVCGVRTAGRAEQAKKALDASNIPSVILSERFMADHPVAESEYSMPGAVDEITVIMVPRDFLDDAEMVVEVVLGDDFVSLDGDEA